METIKKLLALGNWNTHETRRGRRGLFCDAKSAIDFIEAQQLNGSTFKMDDGTILRVGIFENTERGTVSATVWQSDSESVAGADALTFVTSS